VLGVDGKGALVLRSHNYSQIVRRTYLKGICV